jgi:hypothetical protein
MNPTTAVLRWYRQSTGRAVPSQRYTAEEVLQLLRPDDRSSQTVPRLQTRAGDDWHARSEAVRQAATRPTTWLGRLTKQQRREIGELADLLPSLVFHHTNGGDTGELVRRFGGWSTWRYDRALETAGGCIASYLNDPR